jgi:hypothetical protein
MEEEDPPKAQGTTAFCCPYIPTSKRQQDCHKELMRFVIDAELPFMMLDNPRRASRGQLRCSLKWQPWYTFEQQHQEQQSHQPSRSCLAAYVVCLAALDNGQPATKTSCSKQLNYHSKQQTHSCIKTAGFSFLNFLLN